MNLKTIAFITGLIAVGLNMFALIASTWIYHITQDIPLIIIPLSFSMGFIIITLSLNTRIE